MDLPVFRRGLELVSAQLNKLSQGIRAAQVTSVIGGTFTRTPGGTTIIIDQQPQASSAGGGSKVPCPFEATNASTETQQRVEIKQGTVETQNYLNPYQWPDGMGIDFPPYYLEVTGAGYIYCKVVFTPPQYTISTDPTAITFLFSETLQPNTDTDQYILTATIGWDTQTAKITTITNVCTAPVVTPCGLSYTPAP